MTLAEAIISIFLLIFGFAIIARLFQAALSYQANTDAAQLASVIAEAKMENIRGWSWMNHRPGMGAPNDWSSYPGVASTVYTPDPNNPDFLVGVSSATFPLYDPCTQFEQLYQNGSTNPFLNQQFNDVVVYGANVIQTSAQWVRVTVLWSNTHYVCLEALIAAPPANLGTPASSFNTQIVGATSSLADNQIDQLSAQTTVGGQLVPDVTYHWNLAGQGDGTLYESRDGTSASLDDYLYTSDGSFLGYGTGTANLEYTARVRGIEVNPVSGDINVQ